MCDIINIRSDLLTELAALWTAPRAITHITFPGVPDTKVVVRVRGVPGYPKPKHTRMVLPSRIVVRLADANGKVLSRSCQPDACVLPAVLPVPREVLQQAIADMACDPRPVSLARCQSPIPDDDIYGESTPAASLVASSTPAASLVASSTPAASLVASSTPLLRDEDIYA